MGRAPVNKLTIETVAQLYSTVNLISKEYKRNNEKLSWECRTCKHVFPRSKQKMDRSSNCPSCKDKLPLTVQEVQNRLGNRPIKLLSTEMHSRGELLNWQCTTCGHEWPKSYTNTITVGEGCRPCAGNEPYILESIDAKLLEDNRHIKLLTREYANANTDMDWACTVEGCGYVWSAVAGSVLSSTTGCSRCNEMEKFTLESVKDRIIAEEIPFKLLSTEYIDRNKELDWKCNDCEDIIHVTFKTMLHNEYNCSNCRPSSMITANKTNAERHKAEWLQIPTIVYTVNLYNDTETFFKIGLTTKSIRKRMYGIPYTYKVVKEIHTNKYDAVYIEADLHKFHFYERYTPLKDFGGDKECFSEVHVKGE